MLMLYNADSIFNRSASSFVTILIRLDNDIIASAVSFISLTMAIPPSATRPAFKPPTRLDPIPPPPCARPCALPRKCDCDARVCACENRFNDCVALSSCAVFTPICNCFGCTSRFSLFCNVVTCLVAVPVLTLRFAGFILLIVDLMRLIDVSADFTEAMSVLNFNNVVNSRTFIYATVLCSCFPLSRNTVYHPMHPDNGSSRPNRPM